MHWRETVVWVLAAVLCAVCAVVAVLETPAFDLDIDLHQPTVSTQSTAPPVEQATGRINLNYATKAQLCTLPGIGEVIAGRIVEYRERVGGFQSVEQLKQVDGIGDKKFAAVKDLVCVS